jgi:3-hydroxybutyryl-CoA dehydratase
VNAFRVGQELEPVALTVDRDVVAAYAEAGNDPNPIHFSDEAAQALGFPGAIAHGMISGALLSRMLARNLGPAWVSGGRLSIRFVAPVLVGSTVTARGVVTGTDPMAVDVRAETDDGTAVIVGTAEL